MMSYRHKRSGCPAPRYTVSECLELATSDVPIPYIVTVFDAIHHQSSINERNIPLTAKIDNT